MGEVIIKVDQVRKTYRDYRSNLQKMKHMLLMSHAGDKNQVLRNVSFEIEKGENVAILSCSGGGKTTLMRLLAGILKPEKGTIEVKTEPYPIFDFKAGFERTLTGRDNYEILCTLLGWPKELIKEREEKVFKYAGLLEYIDQPLLTYKGVGANRLGSAICTYGTHELILLDERFTFGDKKYFAKLVRRLKKKVSNPEVTFVMAANDKRVAPELCTRGIVLDEGTVVFDGPLEEAMEYLAKLEKARQPEKKSRNEVPDMMQEPEIAEMANYAEEAEDTDSRDEP